MSKIGEACKNFVESIRKLKDKIIRFINYNNVILSFHVFVTVEPPEDDPNNYLHELEDKICYGTDFYMKSAAWASSGEKTTTGKNGRLRDKHGRYKSVVPITYNILVEEQIEVPKKKPGADTRADAYYELQENIIGIQEDYEGEIFKYIITFNSYKEW
jgi:hypothetical protein